MTTASSPGRTIGSNANTSPTTSAWPPTRGCRPCTRASHTDLAPAIIGIGHHDPLLDQNLAYAKVLAAAGVPTVLREYPDLIHGFFGMGGVSASAERAARPAQP